VCVIVFATKAKKTCANSLKKKKVTPHKQNFQMNGRESIDCDADNNVINMTNNKTDLFTENFVKGVMQKQIFVQRHTNVQNVGVEVIFGTGKCTRNL
jgi:hypothetical protein